MPRFGCECGHSIPLHAIPCPHEATLVWDVDQDELRERRREQWTAALEAHARGELAQWTQSFLGRPQRSGADASSADPAPLVRVLADVEWRLDRFSRRVVRCPECGRLWVQREHGGNEYVSYKPESD
jgi:hypothetical protein